MWFLNEKIIARIEAAISNGMQLSESTISAMSVRSGGFGKMVRNGLDAEITIEGVLTNKSDWYASYFGGGNTTYMDIIESVAVANADAGVERIILKVGISPGGNALGLFAAMDAIRDSVKPVIAEVENQATSATFGLVSQAGEIHAGNRATMFGSVGVAYDTWVGANEISIASTDAPKKRPDLNTEVGQGIIRDELDDIHTLFAGSIATGRSTTIVDVNKNYGQGAIVLADAALKAGMIDSIKTAASGVVEEVAMDKNELLAKHPDVYAAVEAGGVAKERDRVVAHLTMGESSGAADVAVAAIKSGANMDQTCTATYLSAGLNRQAVAARAGDNPDVGGPVVAPVAKSAEDVLADEVADLMESGGYNV